MVCYNFELLTEVGANYLRLVWHISCMQIVQKGLARLVCPQGKDSHQHQPFEKPEGWLRRGYALQAGWGKEASKGLRTVATSPSYEEGLDPAGSPDWLWYSAPFNEQFWALGLYPKGGKSWCQKMRLTGPSCGVVTRFVDLRWEAPFEHIA